MSGTVSVDKYAAHSVSEESIRSLLQAKGFPSPETIVKRHSQGSYHIVYTLNYPAGILQEIVQKTSPSFAHPSHPTSLLLRISGTHLPYQKTENESAILRFVANNAPGIPVPLMISADSSVDNAIGQEYQIMTICRGVEVDQLFRDWDDDTRTDFFDQVIALLREFNAVGVAHIGGFRFDGATEKDVVPGPTVEEFAIKMPEIDQFWRPHGLTIAPKELNAEGPYKSYIQLQIGWLQKYVWALENHPLMAEFKYLVPRLGKLIDLLNTGGPSDWKLNQMRMVLAHRDLHFGNIMYDSTTKKITGIIDWEFAGTAAFCRWDPPRAFLASLPYDDEGLRRKRGWVQAFKGRCTKRGIPWSDLIFDDKSGWSSNEQELVYQAVDYMRCIFEVAPSGERLDSVRDWAGIVRQRLTSLGIP